MELNQVNKGVFDRLLICKNYFDYYKTARGFHPRSINANAAWTMASSLSLMNMPILAYIIEISPRSVLLRAGENAQSRYF